MPVACSEAAIVPPTRPALAQGAAQFAGRFVDWYRDSFYDERRAVIESLKTL